MCVGNYTHIFFRIPIMKELHEVMTKQQREIADLKIEVTMLKNIIKEEVDMRYKLYIKVAELSKAVS